ncbi:MAG: hypothetical protein JXR63_10190 [Spirochaetales bacterium]|nr:hypothetical protein [Spirochaetales bacterium]
MTDFSLEELKILYAFLKKNELVLSYCEEKLLEKIEKILFSCLTIEDIEKLSCN